eukprot:CAMPEP_0119135872 /NCGR_PEP_ID=MMETSP1310-20130426/20227_1 /TAXON_ID=464262 /ORGANISM="Genus nov. species nov., Strain RCC2339" /LENGTH=985 /DNA_ID=CAMNT_0007126817 /DNA_START=12 /DNA_END=2966 /DNA_ORIENTATION=-
MALRSKVKATESKGIRFPFFGSGGSSSGKKGSGTTAKRQESTDELDEESTPPGLGAEEGTGASGTSVGPAPVCYTPRQFVIPSGPFAEEDTEENILFEEGRSVNGVPVIKAATLEKLVERVTHEAHPNPKYMARFLLTYRSFTKAEDLLDLLQQRCELPEPKGLSAEDRNTFVKKLQMPVRVRVLNLVKTWISTYIHDFMDDKEFLDKFMAFIARVSEYEGMKLVTKYKAQLEKALKGQEVKAREVVYRQNPPKVIKPNIKGSIDLLQLSPVEVARQLTVIEAELYRKIKPWEFLNQAWAKKGGVKAPNVLEMIRWSTRVSGFVATEIMKAHVGHKVRYISHFIQIAKALRELNNFNALMEIIAGFENAAVWRLQPFFNEVPRRYSQILEELHEVMSTGKNFQSIRATLKTVDMPCIPYLGMYLTDLTFIEDGNPDTVKGNLINFTKRRYVAQVIQDIQQYQQTPFCLKPEPIIQGYLRSLYIWDEEKLYQYSLEFMPRSAKDKSVKELETLYLEKEKEKKASRKKEAEEEGDWGPLEQVEGYPFFEKDSKENVSFDENGKFVAASLPKLVQRLTAQPTPGYMETFLISWPTFCTAKELAQLLLQRYNVPQLMSDDEKKKEEYEKRTFSIKSRVINILKALVDKFSFHFLVSDDLFIVISDLLREIRPTAGVLSGAIDRIEKHLGALAAKSRENKLGKVERRNTPNFPTSQDTSSQGIMRYTPDLLAHTLSLIHHDVFLGLRPHCLLNMSISDDTPVVKDPHWHDAMKEFLGAYSAAEVFVYDFTVSQIISGNSPNDRSQSIEFLIDVCDFLEREHNYCTLLWVLNGLSSKTVRRLSSTWSRVSSAKRNLFKDLQKTMKTCCNVHSFREKTYEPGDRFTIPCIPPVESYLAAYLQRLDLPDRIEGDLINFEKREGMASLVHDILKLQNLKYVSSSNAEVKRYLNFQQRKLNVKGDILPRVAKVLAEEPENFGSDHEDIFVMKLIS